MRGFFIARKTAVETLTPEPIRCAGLVAGLTSITISTVTIGLMRELRAKFKMDSHDEAEKDKHGFAVAVCLAHTGLTEEQRAT